MILKNNEGYYFISKSGIRYDLYEGFTMGGDKRYTSDAIFIMLSEIRGDVDTMLVNYIMGASFLEDDIERYESDIQCFVDWYETRNKLKKEF